MGAEDAISIATDFTDHFEDKAHHTWENTHTLHKNPCHLCGSAGKYPIHQLTNRKTPVSLNPLRPLFLSKEDLSSQLILELHHEAALRLDIAGPSCIFRIGDIVHNE